MVKIKMHMVIEADIVPLVGLQNSVEEHLLPHS
jgi:hypothetical protein